MIQITVNVNLAKNGFEIVFSEKPGPTTRTFLKSAKFRWSPRQGLWWARRNESTTKAIELFKERVGNCEEVELLTTWTPESAPMEDAFLDCRL